MLDRANPYSLALFCWVTLLCAVQAQACFTVEEQRSEGMDIIYHPIVKASEKEDSSVWGFSLTVLFCVQYISCRCFVPVPFVHKIK